MEQLLIELLRLFFMLKMQTSVLGERASAVVLCLYSL